jgi:type II secretory pathway pseudopilin PulG
MKNLFKQKNTGFTLVETLVAVSIFSVALIGMMAVIASSMAHTSYAKRKITAAYLAQEGIEYIKNMRDTYVLDENLKGWGTPSLEESFMQRVFGCEMNNNNNNKNGCGIDISKSMNQGNFLFKCNNASDKCDLYVSDGKYRTYPSGTAAVGTDSGFIRRIWREPVNDNEIKIFSSVEWKQGSGNYSITFSENLFNWIK